MLFLLTLWPAKLTESQNFHEKPTTPTPSFAEEETESQNCALHAPNNTSPGGSGTYNPSPWP